MLQAPHEAPSNAVDFDITHQPLPRKIRCIPYIRVGTTDTPWIWGFSYTLDGPSFSERFITVGSLNKAEQRLLILQRPACSRRA